MDSLENLFTKLISAINDEISSSVLEKIKPFILEVLANQQVYKNELISTELLCEKLSLSKSTIIKQRKLGLPYIRIGDAIRFDLVEVVDFLQKNYKVVEAEQQE